jgi:hypothetical protein
LREFDSFGVNETIDGVDLVRVDETLAARVGLEIETFGDESAYDFVYGDASFVSDVG